MPVIFVTLFERHRRQFNFQVIFSGPHLDEQILRRVLAGLLGIAVFQHRQIQFHAMLADHRAILVTVRGHRERAIRLNDGVRGLAEIVSGRRHCRALRRENQQPPRHGHPLACASSRDGGGLECRLAATGQEQAAGRGKHTRCDQ
jgi:hypothetical protein